MAVGLTVGCGDDGDDPVAADDAGDEPSGLEGRAFVSEALTEGGQPKALVEGTQVRVELTGDGQININAGCNTMSATPTITADRIDTAASGMSTEEKGCPPDLAAQDQWLTTFFGDSPTYALDGDALRLTAGDRVIDLVDQTVGEPILPLEGTEWTLDGLIDGDSVSSVPGGVAATLTFEGGTVTVDGTGCNGGSGSYAIEGGDAAAAGELILSALMWTMMACGEPSATVEAAFSAVLDGTITYQIDIGALTLTHPGGTGLSLRAV